MGRSGLAAFGSRRAGGPGIVEGECGMTSAAGHLGRYLEERRRHVGRRVYGVRHLLPGLSGARPPRLRRPQAHRRSSRDPRVSRRGAGDGRRAIAACSRAWAATAAVRGSVLRSSMSCSSTSWRKARYRRGGPRRHRLHAGPDPQAPQRVVAGLQVDAGGSPPHLHGLAAAARTLRVLRRLQRLQPAGAPSRGDGRPCARRRGRRLSARSRPLLRRHPAVHGRPRGGRPGDGRPRRLTRRLRARGGRVLVPDLPLPVPHHRGEGLRTAVRDVSRCPSSSPGVSTASRSRTRCR